LKREKERVPDQQRLLADRALLFMQLDSSGVTHYFQLLLLP